MAGMRTRGRRGADLGRNMASRAADIAALLRHECSLLVELYRNKENFPSDVAGVPLVSIPSPSSHLDPGDKLWHLHSALEQCCSLMERAIVREKEEFDGGEMGEYEKRRKMVKDRLSRLVIVTRDLLKATDGPSIVTTSLDASQLDGPTALFELKLWVYGIFMEVEHWSNTAIQIFQDLQPDATKVPSKRTRSSRIAPRMR
ncbi:ciliary neurotrophic factor [Cyprinodon tularosa]|uniref:ciliary neurotrophic factor n=1 Tax=Cyprinodon tularosa TaxID=77115 RepID=UPI0018E1DB50|nr:ciliary neurotrophic factor [Cyprinodon tularosa]